MLEMEKRAAATSAAHALVQRPRRLRRTGTMRRMVRETVLGADDFILPLFVTPGTNMERPISSMPGHSQLSVDLALREVDNAASLGIPAVLLFGIPAGKDPTGSGAWDKHGPVQRAIGAIKQHSPETVV